MKNNKPSRSPDFNLFLSAGAVQGALEAIFEMTAELPAEGPELNRWFGSLSGLAWNGRRAAREVHEFLGEASDTHHFPTSYAQLERERERERECDCDVDDTPPRHAQRR